MKKLDPFFNYIIELCGEGFIEGKKLQQLDIVCDTDKTYEPDEKYKVLYYNYGGIIVKDIEVKQIYEL